MNDVLSHKLTNPKFSIEPSKTEKKLSNLNLNEIPRNTDNKTENKKYISLNDELHYDNLTDILKNSNLISSRDSNLLLKNLISEMETDNPIFLADLSKLVHQHLKWIENLPTVKPFYAVKCNNNPEVVKTLIKLGCSFDCASKGEIEAILNYGVDPSKIIYANPCKPPTHLKFACDNKIDLMTYDGIEELDKIKIFHPNARLVIRIRVDDSKSICQFGAKFGVHNGKTRDLIEKTFNAGMNLVGVSFHVGSGCGDENVYYDAIKKAREIFDEADEFGYKLTLLDIGGGFPGHDDGSIKFENYCKVINDSVNHFFSDLKINVIAEPGRYYASSIMTLACSVNGRRTVDNENVYDDTEMDSESTEIDDSKSFMYYISDGVYGSLNCILYDHWEVTELKYLIMDSFTNELVVISKEDLKNKKKFNSKIWGPTCDSMDCITKNFPMPKLKIGDWIIFENTGAYTIAAGCEFNGFLRPEIYFLDTRISKTSEKILFDFYNK